MRHRVARTKLNRDLDHRKTMLRNLTTSLILNEKIKTTVAKAKFLQPHVESIVTKAIKLAKIQDKSAGHTGIKLLSAEVYSAEVVKKLIQDIATRFKSTAGGYTKVIRVGNRAGDNAELARIEFTAEKVVKPTKTTKQRSKKTETVKEELEQKGETN